MGSLQPTGAHNRRSPLSGRTVYGRGSPREGYSYTCSYSEYYLCECYAQYGHMLNYEYGCRRSSRPDRLSLVRFQGL